MFINPAQTKAVEPLTCSRISDFRLRLVGSFTHNASGRTIVTNPHFAAAVTRDAAAHPPGFAPDDLSEVPTPSAAGICIVMISCLLRGPGSYHLVRSS